MASIHILLLQLTQWYLVLIYLSLQSTAWTYPFPCLAEHTQGYKPLSYIMIITITTITPQAKYIHYSTIYKHICTSKLYPYIHVHACCWWIVILSLKPKLLKQQNPITCNVQDYYKRLAEVAAKVKTKFIVILQMLRT